MSALEPWHLAVLVIFGIGALAGGVLALIVVALRALRPRPQRRRDSGSSALEYALLCAVMAATIIVPVRVMSQAVGDLFEHAIEQAGAHSSASVSTTASTVP